MDDKFITMTFTVKSNWNNEDVAIYYRQKMREAGLLFDDLKIEVEDV